MCGCHGVDGTTTIRIGPPTASTHIVLAHPPQPQANHQIRWWMACVCMFGVCDSVCMWGAGGGRFKHHYARTATRVVENLQILAARAARLVWNGSPDLFGEEEAIEGLRLFLQTRHVQEERIRRQLEVLTLADNSRPIPLAAPVITAVFLSNSFIILFRLSYSPGLRQL